VHGELRAKVQALAPGDAPLKVAHNTEEECRKSYEAIWRWRRRHNNEDDLRVVKRGTDLYVERNGGSDDA
jgi:hypothetical protein